MRRPIREDERRLLVYLAGLEPVYRAAYEQQAREIVEVDDVENDGTFISLSSTVGLSGVRVEACAEDEGGETIDIMLHGDDRQMRVLELLLYHGGIKRFPSPENLKSAWDYTESSWIRLGLRKPRRQES